MKSTQRLSDLKVMSTDQLQDELLKLKKEQFNLRFQKATGQMENTSRVTEVRRDIARVKTLSRQKAGPKPVQSKPVQSKPAQAKA